MMINLELGEIQGFYDRMVTWGAIVVDPLQSRFWGAKMGVLKDPFGVDWAVHADESPAKAVDGGVTSEEHSGPGSGSQPGAKRPRTEEDSA